MAEKVLGGVYSESERTPYTSLGRLAQPKETFKAALGLIKPRLGTKAGALIDLGCANGEFIHYLAQNLPAWSFTGIDITPAFIDVAKSIGLPNAQFSVGDLFAASGRYDVVTCIGTLPMFAEIEPALEHMMSLCTSGGIVVADGFFNAYNMDVRIEFRENVTGAETNWHIGFNHFSRARIEKWLEMRDAAFEFHDVAFNTDLPRDSAKPPVSAWTFRDENGKRLLTNGLGIHVNTTMLVIKSAD
jgi:SAM-dependent methyltransferase